jgi:hypothetical protein
LGFSIFFFLWTESSGGRFGGREFPRTPLGGARRGRASYCCSEWFPLIDIRNNTAQIPLKQPHTFTITRTRTRRQHGGKQQLLIHMALLLIPESRLDIYPFLSPSRMTHIATALQLDGLFSAHHRDRYFHRTRCKSHRLSLAQERDPLFFFFFWRYVVTFFFFFFL